MIIYRASPRLRCTHWIVLSPAAMCTYETFERNGNEHWHNLIIHMVKSVYPILGNIDSYYVCNKKRYILVNNI